MECGVLSCVFVSGAQGEEVLVTVGLVYLRSTKTNQTHLEGDPPNAECIRVLWQVMVAQALDITRETYFAILMDRSFAGPVMVGSPAGGMDIEEVASKTPELIFKVALHVSLHTMTYYSQKPAFACVIIQLSHV